MQEAVRELVGKHARLGVDVATLDDDGDLYEAGLTSLTTVNLMLAIENHFRVEFPDHMLGRATFESVQAIVEALEELVEA